MERKARKAKRGVSPVLATMIMVGVAVAVGLGVASYTMGLFGSFSKSAQVSLVSVDVLGTGDDEVVTFVIKNDGAVGVKLTRVETTIGANFYSADLDDNNSIGPSSEATIVINNNDWDNDPAFEEGKTYTFTLKFSDGTVLTTTAIAR